MTEATPASAPTGPAEPTTEQLEEGVVRTRLPGGAEVWSERMESMRSVAVGYWFRSGAAHDADESAGTAHLLEHMVFKGSRRRSARELVASIEDLGGSLDAFTTQEHTAFLARVPDEEIETAVDVLADLSFEPRLDPHDLALEREVVLEELARAEETPDDLVFDLHAEFMFGDHPYGRPILGRRETVAAIDADTLRGLHEAAYRPANLVVSAAGRLEHEAFLELVQTRLDGASGSAREQVARPERWGSGHRRVERPGGQQVHVVAGAAGVAVTDPRRPAVSLVGTALGGGMGSRLFQRIREELGLAYAVFAFRGYYRSGGHVGAYLGTRPDTAARARDALIEELGRLAADGLGLDELEATRAQLKGSLVLSLESPVSRMFRLAANGLTEEPYRSLDTLVAEIEAVGPAEVDAAAALYDPDGLAVLELSPA